MANRPAPEIEIDRSLVTGLIEEQIPELAGQPLTLGDRGWDNTNWRLGDHLVVRVPHRSVAAPLVVNEQTWLGLIDSLVDLDVPSPMFAGRPSQVLGFPWSWSISPWFEGADGAVAALEDPAASALALGNFFAQLHVDAHGDAPVNPYRGGPLSDRLPDVRARSARLASRVDATAAVDLFQACAAVAASTERVWVHGDLHPRNIVVEQGRISAIIDWGDLCCGDRATDLAGALMLVPDQLDVIKQQAGADESAWDRACGWGVHFGLAYLDNSDDAPEMAAIAVRLLNQLGIEAS